MDNLIVFAQYDGKWDSRNEYLNFTMVGQYAETTNSGRVVVHTRERYYYSVSSG